jgi:hypothetical protein
MASGVVQLPYGAAYLNAGFSLKFFVGSWLGNSSPIDFGYDADEGVVPYYFSNSTEGFVFGFRG